MLKLLIWHFATRYFGIRHMEYCSYTSLTWFRGFLLPFHLVLRYSWSHFVVLCERFSSIIPEYTPIIGNGTVMFDVSSPSACVATWLTWPYLWPDRDWPDIILGINLQVDVFKTKLIQLFDATLRYKHDGVWICCLRPILQSCWLNTLSPCQSLYSKD